MVAATVPWDELFKLAAAEILNLAISPLVLKRFGIAERAFEYLADMQHTWVRLAVLQVVGEQDLVAGRLESAIAFHRSGSDHAAAHANLLLGNTFRTPWLAAKLLSHSNDIAQYAAKSLARHLVTTKPGNITSFESHLLSEEELWQNLEGFTRAGPPVLLWKGHGKFEAIFQVSG